MLQLCWTGRRARSVRAGQLSERPSRSHENARARAIHSEIDGASFGAIAAAAAVAQRAISETPSFISTHDSGSSDTGGTGSDEQRTDIGGGIRGAMTREQSLRSDADGGVYSREQFVEHYGGEEEWNTARRRSGSRSGSRNGSRPTSARIALGIDEALASDPSESDSVEEDPSERRYDVGRSILNVLKSKKSMRADADGAVYSRQDFIDFYGGTAEWDAAKRLRIDVAARRASGAASAAAAAAAAAAAEFDDSVDEARAAEEADAIDEAAAAHGAMATPRSREPSEESEPALFLPPEEESDNAPQFGDEDDLPPPMDEGRKSPTSEDEAPGWASPALQGEDAHAGGRGVEDDVGLLPPDGESDDGVAATLSPPDEESSDAPQWEAADGDGGIGHDAGASALTMSFDL